MAIQMRRGLRADFDPTKMLAGEWAVAIDADTNNQIVWMCFGNGVVKRMGTYEDFMAQLDDFKAELEEEFRGLFDQMAEEIQRDLSLVETRLNGIDEELEIRLKQPFIGNEGAKTLTDSDDGYMRELEIDGATEQKQYVGRNKYIDANKITNRLKTLNSTKTTEDNVVTFITNSGSFSSGGIYVSSDDFNFCINTVGIESGTVITLSAMVKANSGNSIRFGLDNDTSTFTTNGNWMKVTKTITYDSTKKNNHWHFYTSVTNLTVQVKEMMVEIGDTSHDYEPFVGGIPSPSPEYPQTIESVGEADAIAMEVVKPIRMPLVKGDSSGSLLDSRATCFTNGAYGHKVRIENHTLKPLNMQGWGFSWASNILASGAYVETVISGRYEYIVFGSSQGLTSDDMLVNVRVYDLSTEKQTVIIPLSAPLYGIGDVRDYLDVERGVRKFGITKGNVFTVRDLTTSADYGDYAYIENVIAKVDSGTPNFICSSFVGISFADRVKDANSYRCYVDNNGRLVLRFPKGIHKTVAEINAILENAEYYFVSATPTEEPIPAETLALLRDLRTYYPSTNVTVTDGKFDVDTEFLYKLRLESYIKKVTGQITDTRKTIDNIDARQIEIETMTALAYINSEYATALAELN